MLCMHVIILTQLDQIPTIPSPCASSALTRLYTVIYELGLPSDDLEINAVDVYTGVSKQVRPFKQFLVSIQHLCICNGALMVGSANDSRVHGAVLGRPVY